VTKGKILFEITFPKNQQLERALSRNEWLSREEVRNVGKRLRLAQDLQHRSRKIEECGREEGGEALIELTRKNQTIMKKKESGDG